MSKSITTKTLGERGKLLFIAPSAYSLGGLPIWLDYLIPGLNKKGWKTILGLTFGRFHDFDSYLKNHPADNVMKINNPTGTREGRIRNICKAIEKIKPDIVVAVNIPDTYAAANRIRLKNGVDLRVIMTLHGIQPDLYEDVKFSRNVLDGVICTNRLACRLVQEDAGMNSEKLYYAPYGVDIPIKPYNFSGNDKCLHIAYSGRFDNFQKRVDDISGIMNQLNSKGICYKLMLAGGGPRKRALKKSFNSVGYLNKIEFLGVVSYNDLFDRLYCNADVLLVTSSWETGPIVIWEAMSHGVAVVTSSFIGSGLEGSLKNNENCLTFPVGDVTLAASNIERLLDSTLRRSIASRAYELIKSRYSYYHSIESWDNCFRKILSVPSCGYSSNLGLIKPAGRLDSVFGVYWGENIRNTLGLSFKHNGPGGEWPHSYGMRPINDNSFWKLAKKLDSQNITN